MQDLTTELDNKPALAVNLLAEAEDNNLPKCAAACEHFIAKNLRRLPITSLNLISQAASIRILRAVAQQRDGATDKLDRYSGQIPALPSVDTMLKWR